MSKVYYANPHSPFEGWFTLFTVPFPFWRVHHPSRKVNHPFRKVNELLEKRFTLQKGWTYSLLRINHPSRRDNHPKIGWITLKKDDSPFKKGESLRSLRWKRVNGIRVNHPSKGWTQILNRSPFYNSDDSLLA